MEVSSPGDVSQPKTRLATEGLTAEPERERDLLLRAALSKTTGLFWHDRHPRPVTCLIGAGADLDAARRELWGHVAALARRSQPRPAS